ncbi:hypothetical protein B0H11DRAFT_1936820 [Mycena galericulata]|nr:hypothetical protein B0H11DRAFT_1936820 [Mycena galericulata]
MGRELLTVVLHRERVSFARASHLSPNFTDEDLMFYAPTTDPMVATVRRMLDPTYPRAVEHMPTKASESPALTIVPPSSATREFDAGVSIPFSLEMPCFNSALDAAPRPGAPRTFMPAVLSIPVCFVDSMLSHSYRIPRYAVLGPNRVGLLARDRVLQLTNERSELVVVKKNHGAGPDKPLCYIVEAERVDAPTGKVVLLATGFMIHPSFHEEVRPNPTYIGGREGIILHDRIRESDALPYYGVSVLNYLRVGESPLLEALPGDFYRVHSLWSFNAL